MKNSYSLKQCHLQRGDVHQISWIPDRFAIEGKYVKLHEEDGWLIVSAGKYSISNEYISKMEYAARNHRKTTDI